MVKENLLGSWGASIFGSTRNETLAGQNWKKEKKIEKKWPRKCLEVWQGVIMRFPLMKCSGSGYVASALTKMLKHKTINYVPRVLRFALIFV